MSDFIQMYILGIGLIAVSALARKLLKYSDTQRSEKKVTPANSSFVVNNINRG